MADNGGPVEVFYSYSHRDERLRDKLENHLSILKRQKVITEWHDRKITAGDEWTGKIDDHINSAVVILLLISDEFLASDYCYDMELKRAMERHAAGEAIVIPVILTPCLWEGASFADLQALPKDAKPVTSWRNRDEAWTNVASGIREAIEELNGSTSSSVPEKATAGSAGPPRENITTFERRLSQLRKFRIEHGIHEEVAMEFERRILNKWLEEE